MGNEKQVQHGISGTSWKNGRCECEACRTAGLAHAKGYWAARKDRIDAGDYQVNHGTHSGYSQGCRCDSCKDASRAYQREYRAKRREHIASGGDIVHGTSGGYGYGCRCVPCKAGNFVMDNKIPRENIALIVALYEAHDGKCEICGSEEKLQIDHDHETGKVRGLLCGLCNKGLGMFRDSVEWLEGAVRYLREAR